MAGVFLGMSLGTLIATGISVAGSSAAAIGSARKANEAGRRARSAFDQGKRMQQKVIDRIGASNFMRQLTVNKKASEDAIDALIASQAGQQLGMGDQRGASAGAARQQATLLKGLGQVQDAEIKQQQDIQKAIAEEDVRIAEQIGGIELGQADQQFKASENLLQQEVALRQQARKSAGDAMSTLGEAVIPSMVEGIDRKRVAKGLEKTAGDMSAFSSESDPLKAYFGGQASGFDKTKGTFDLDTVDNKALRGIFEGNQELASGFGSQVVGGASGADLTDYLLQNLEMQEVYNILGGMQ